jgi:hypothetical protein
MQVFNIILDKDSKILDLKSKIALLVSEKGELDPSTLVIANVDIKTRIIETKFKNS